MLIWKEIFQVRQKFLVGYKNNEILFTITEDSTGYQCLQGYNKYKNHRSRHIDKEGAKNKAEEKLTWGK
jgi:hypothetical protein